MSHFSQTLFVGLPKGVKLASLTFHVALYNSIPIKTLPRLATILLEPHVYSSRLIRLFQAVHFFTPRQKGIFSPAYLMLASVCIFTKSRGTDVMFGWNVNVFSPRTPEHALGGRGLFLFFC